MLSLLVAIVFAVVITCGLRQNGVSLEGMDANDSNSSRASAAVILGFGFIIATTYGAGYVLPTYDPIAVPLLAKTILGGMLPLDAFPMGSSAHSYPPGYPILFAPMLAVLPFTDSLLFFKILNISTIVLIPACWAWMQEQVLPTNIPTWQFLVASYLAFFGIERTLGFALPFAGKNAVLLGVLLVPIAVVTMIRLAKNEVRWPLMAAPFFGLVLIHYSMLHMMAALIASYIAIGLCIKHVTWREALRLALAGVITLGLLLFFLHEALTDPRAGGFTFAPLEGAHNVFRTLIAKYSFMVIYGDQDFGILKFPYRGLALMFCTGASVIISYKTNVPNLRYAALWYFGALVGTLAMALGVVPSGLAVDFARWFLWAIQAAIFLTALTGLLLLVRYSVGLRKNMSILAVCITAILAFTLMLLDRTIYINTNEAQRVTRAQLIEMQSVLHTASSGQSCFIASESTSIPDLLVTIQKEKRWEYAEIVTDCIYLTGSWMHPGAPGGRTLGGLPSETALDTLSDQAALIFLGTELKLAEYTKQLRQRGLILEAKQVSGTDDLAVWHFTVHRMVPDSDNAVH